MIPSRNRDEIPKEERERRDRSNRPATRTSATRDKTEWKTKKGKTGVQAEEEGRDRMINRFSQYLSRDHGNFSNIVPSIPSDNGISILPADKRSISPFGPIDPASSNQQLTILFPKKDLLLWEDGTTSTSGRSNFSLHEYVLENGLVETDRSIRLEIIHSSLSFRVIIICLIS